MGNIAPIAAQAVQALQTAGTIASTVQRGTAVFDESRQKSDNMTLEQLKARQKLEEQRAAEKNALDKIDIAEKAAQADQERRESLKRAVARQRAQFGASGIRSSGGSSEAVLLGLFEETEDDLAKRERLDNIRLRALDQSLVNQRRVNTLERTQAAERNRLKNASSDLDEAAGLFNIF